MEKYKRIFVIVMDSLGVGAMDDSPEFGDVGVNTLGHISQSVDSFCMPWGIFHSQWTASVCPIFRKWAWRT